jgi:hypothetical protein
MAGGARWGAGRKPKSLRLHLLRGTYRADRHGPIPSNLDTAEPEIAYDWQPSETDLQQLGDVGKRFIHTALSNHEFNFVSGYLLLDMACTLDLLRAFRNDIAARGYFIVSGRGRVKLNPSVREHGRALRWFGVLAKQLDLDVSSV